MKTSIGIVKTYHSVNLACFVVGLATVWHFTHSWLGILGAFIASLHFARKVQPGQCR